jgi:hypothetical protein
MTLCDLIVIGWHFMVPRGQRVFHQIAAIVLTTAAIAYFAMASDLGATPIATEFSHQGRIAGVSRQIWVSTSALQGPSSPTLPHSPPLSLTLPRSTFDPLAHRRGFCCGSC